MIGHCCAGKAQRAEAEREYKKRTQKDYEETLLLATLPIILKRGEILSKLRPAAEEARRVYRKFRKEVPTIHGHLRELKARGGGLHPVPTDTELGVLMEPEVGHGEAEVYAGVQA